WYARIPRPYQTKRMLRLLHVADVRWLRPSYSSAADMMALARHLVRGGRPMLNLLSHSSEAIAGGSPYNRTAGDLEGFFDRLSTFLRYAIGDLGATPLTFGEFRSRYLDIDDARERAAASEPRERRGAPG